MPGDEEAHRRHKAQCNPLEAGGGRWLTEVKRYFMRAFVYSFHRHV